MIFEEIFPGMRVSGWEVHRNAARQRRQRNG